MDYAGLQLGQIWLNINVQPKDSLGTQGSQAGDLRHRSLDIFRIFFSMFVRRAVLGFVCLFAIDLISFVRISSCQPVRLGPQNQNTEGP